MLCMFARESCTRIVLCLLCYPIRIVSDLFKLFQVMCQPKAYSNDAISFRYIGSERYLTSIVYIGLHKVVYIRLSYVRQS